MHPLASKILWTFVGVLGVAAVYKFAKPYLPAAITGFLPF